MIFQLIFALQLHCGIQQLGDQYLSYGLLVYTGTEEPQITYFDQPQDEFKEHPYCQKIREKMEAQTFFLIRVSEDGKQLLEIN